MSIKEKAIKGILWSVIQNWGSQVISLVVFFVLARLLAPDAFGLVALANIFLALMQTFLNQGFAQALIQTQELKPEKIDTAFWTNLAIGILLTVISWTGAVGIASLFKQPELAPILRGFSVLFLINSASNIQQALLERDLKFKAIAIRSLAGTFVGGCVGISMALSNFGVWSLVCQQIAQEVVGALLLWYASEWRPKFRFSRHYFGEMFSFGINILGFNFLSFLNTRADDFLIGYFLGTVALGYYAISYRILGVMTQLLISTANQVALPTFSRLQIELEKLRQAFYTATQFTSLISFPVFLGVATLAPELVVLLFGKQWIPSIPVLQILAFSGIFKSVNFFRNSLFIAMGKPSWSVWIGLLNVVLNLISFTLVVRWGIVAVASAYVIRGYLVFPIAQGAANRLIKVPFLTYLRLFLVPLFGSLVMVAAILGTKTVLTNIVSLQALLVICILIGIIIYGLIIRLFSPELFKDLLGIINLARSQSKTKNP
ncbi:MAG: lipopolysaccharide biosynthesis protein [Methylacidiphilales bacterium]|nr:lipopolysaccharide biosynthesis protein [Candidatus Methylacidiphilales bacterium]NJR17746.1 lipopolysaccharide biosynthesis protein [Calothrix sp. CSU_2_0]